MNNQKMIIDEQKAYPLAEKRFVRTCGFDLSTEKHQRMMNLGLKVLEDGVSGIKIQAVTSFYGAEVWQDGKIIIDGIEVKCNYFEQIPKETVEGIYFYMLSVGECHFSSEENIMDFLYADIWGSSYVDAGIDLLKAELIADMKERLGNNQELYLSEEFGPGYFGMPVIESKKFFQILDGDSIDVWVKDSGLMIPQKTCAGLYIVLNTPEVKAEPECLRCHGNTAGCKFCKIKAEMEEERQ